MKKIALLMLLSTLFSSYAEAQVQRMEKLILEERPNGCLLTGGSTF